MTLCAGNATGGWNAVNATDCVAQDSPAQGYVTLAAAQLACASDSACSGVLSDACQAGGSGGSGGAFRACNASHALRMLSSPVSARCVHMKPSSAWPRPRPPARAPLNFTRPPRASLPDAPALSDRAAPRPLRPTGADEHIRRWLQSPSPSLPPNPAWSSLPRSRQLTLLL